MPISFVGIASGTDSATVPTHQIGDLICVFAFRDGNTNAPTMPGTFSSIGTTTATSCSCIAGYRIATSITETTGTWTNATSLMVAVYRGVHRESPIGGSDPGSAVSSTVSYDAITMTNTDGTSWVVGAAGHRSTNTTIGSTAPAGLLNRGEVNDATDEAGWFDSAGGLTTWSAQTAAVGGTSSGWCSVTWEIKAAPVPAGFVQCTAWTSPGTVSATGWSSPTNVTAYDSLGATTTVSGGAETGELRCYNFGFSIPSQAIIRGFDIEVNAAMTSGSLDYDYGFIYNQSTFHPRIPAAFGLPDITSNFRYLNMTTTDPLFGGVDSDNNNTYDRDWLPSDINSSDFGVYFVWAGALTVNVDHVRVRVYYSNPIRMSMMGYGI